MKKKLTIALEGPKPKDSAERREEWILMFDGSLRYLSRDRLIAECRKRKIPIAKLKGAMSARLATHLVDAGLPVTVTIG